MDMPTTETPADAYLPRSAYTISRVAADPKAAGSESGLDSAHNNLRAAIRERDDLKEEEQKKDALLDANDENVDDDVEGFELGLLGAVKKDRDNPKYRRYFKSGLRAVTMAEPRKAEPELVSDMLVCMAEDLNDPDIGAVVTQWKPKLTASHAKVVAADEALTAVEKTLANLEEKKIPALMATWREEYKKLEGTLLTVYPTNPKRIARFFKAFRRARKPSKPQLPQTPPATP
jgi:hypothetical protein